MDKNSPEFYTNDNVLQLLELNFTKLLATANRDALLYFFDWMNNVSTNITNMQKQYNYNSEPPLQVQKPAKLKRMHLVSNALSTILEESAASKVQQCMYNMIKLNIEYCYLLFIIKKIFSK